MRESKYSFTGGLNRDIAKNRFPKSKYYYLENGRILTNDGGTSTNIVSIKGNSSANILDTTYGPYVKTGFVIIGNVTVLDDIVLFYATEDTTVDSLLTTSIIEVLEYQGDDTYQRRECWKGVGLNFRSDKPITAKSRYDQDIIQKIYWTDNNEELKQANIGIDISANTASDFKFIGGLTKTNAIQFEGYTSGTLNVGSIMYAYRFIKQDGLKSNFSQLSSTIPLGRNIEDAIGPSETKGDAVYDVDNSYSSNKGTKLSLDITYFPELSSYDIIQVVSLWYSSDDAVPDVKVIYSQNITSSSTVLNFIDEGSADYGSLDSSEITYVQTPIRVKDLEIKDHRLFVANTNENYFDLDAELVSEGFDKWDARAYRFTSALTAPLYDASYTLENTLVGPTPDFTTIDEELDCVNVYNRVTADSTEEEYSGLHPKYQADGPTLGGTGLNIKYSFGTTSFGLGIMSTSTPEIYTSNEESEYYKGQYKTLQRDEIYRVGIVFYDGYGRPSYTKWIGDIRTPSISDFGNLTDGTSTIAANTIHLNVELLNQPKLKGVFLDWQIVYVKREQSDKSISYAGIMNGAIDTIPTDHNYGATAMAASYVRPFNELNVGQPIYQLYSPDINFRKTEFLNADFLQVVGELSVGSAVPMWKDFEADSYSLWQLTDTNTYIKESIDNDFIYIRRYPLVSSHAYDRRLTVNSTIKSIVQTTASTSLQLDSITYTNYSIYTFNSSGLRTISSPQGTCMVCETSSLAIDVSGNLNVPYAYARVANHNSRYGGQSYIDRSTNTYIPLGDKVIGGFNTTECKYGDTFINLYNHYKTIGMTDDEVSVSDEHNAEWIQFACESSINVVMRNDDTYSDLFGLDGTAPCLMKEDAYVESTSGISFDGLYKYNSAYSNLNDLSVFVNKPFNFLENDYHANRVRYSDIYTGSSDTDPWLEFSTNNYNTSNKAYGPINKLVGFNDRIFSFQDSAISMIAINPKVTQQSEDGVTVIMGTGETIDDFNYLTTDIGCQDNSDIIKSLSAMYWLDKNKKKLYSYGQGMSSVSDMKGIHSYLKNNISEDSVFKGVYDFNNSEVLMTVTDDMPNMEFINDSISSDVADLTGYGYDVDSDYLGVRTFVKDGVYNLIPGGWYRFIELIPNGFRFVPAYGVNIVEDEIVDLSNFFQERDNFTIAFNEKLQSFTGFYSFLPSMYIKHTKGFFSSNNSLDLYQHGTSENYNYFYGVYHPLKLTVILNKDNAQSEYTNLKVFTQVDDSSGNNYRNETFTSINAKNKYQYSGKVELYPKDLNEDGSLGTKYILDSSSIKIGRDWFTGIESVDTGSLVAYQGELYRSLIDANTSTPPLNYELAELANIRKVIEEWNIPIPRVNPIDVDTTLHSNRISGDYVELSFTFDKSTDTTKKIQIGDLTVKDTTVNY